MEKGNWHEVLYGNIYNMKKLTACIICKNEESCIEKCLNSIEWVDELIILDTWSTDKTMELARKYTDNVYKDISFYDEEKWIFDFWAARNKCKEFATGDFILSIDCDEVMEEGGIEKIKYAIANTPKCDWVLINLLEENGTAKTSAFRVFKKKLDWQGAIHEIVHPKNPAKLDVTITFGISPTHYVDPHLDMRILQTEYERDPTNPRTCYYLARELINYKEFEAGAGLMGEYIRLSKSIDEQTDWYYWLALAFLYLWKREEAVVAASQALLRNPNFKAAIELIADCQPIQEWKDRWNSFAEGANDTGLIYIHNFKQECQR